MAVGFTQTTRDSRRGSQPSPDRQKAADPLAVGGGGHPLSGDVREQMERAFGTTFEDVRVSEGADVAAMGAHAWTQGAHVRFAPGRMDFSSRAGLHVLGHELTHVLQQRAGRVRFPAGGKSPLNTESSLEGEADRLGAMAARGEAVGLSAPAAGSAVGSAPVQAMFDHGAMTDKDLARGGYQDTDGGSANRTVGVTYTSEIGDSGTNKGVFKPDALRRGDMGGATGGYVDSMMAGRGGGMDDDYAFHSSARAVASSRLDKKLGFNVLSEEKFGKHTDGNGKEEIGSVSAMVKDSVPLVTTHFDGPVETDLNRVASQPASYKKGTDGQYREKSKQSYRAIDHSDRNKSARTQRDMANLQLLDTLTGQQDRHGGNIFYNPTTGGVKGIDNDLAFGTKHTAKEGGVVGSISDAPELAKWRDPNMHPDDQAMGKILMPTMVDKKAAKAVLKMTPKEMDEIIKGKDKDLTRLGPEEMAAGRERLSAVQEHLKYLKENKMLVKKWDDTTLAKSTAATPGYQEGTKRGTSENYLKRHGEFASDTAAAEAKLAADEAARAAAATTTTTTTTTEPPLSENALGNVQTQGTMDLLDTPFKKEKQTALWIPGALNKKGGPSAATHPS